MLRVNISGNYTLWADSTETFSQLNGIAVLFLVILHTKKVFTQRYKKIIWSQIINLSNTGGII